MDSEDSDDREYRKNTPQNTRQALTWNPLGKREADGDGTHGDETSRQTEQGRSSPDPE
jgi:hypothetical protein